jgi:hypothetical protein
MFRDSGGRQSRRAFQSVHAFASLKLSFRSVERIRPTHTQEAMIAGHTIAAIVWQFEKVGPASLATDPAVVAGSATLPTFITAVFRRHQKGFSRFWLSYAILRSRVA